MGSLFAVARAIGALTAVAAVLPFAAGPASAVTTTSNVCETSTYNGFTAGDQTLRLNGHAAVVGGRLRVTPSALNRAGSAFTTNEVELANDGSFSAYFRFQFTEQFTTFGSIPGADGLVFVVQNVANNVGTSGGGIGYQGIGSSVGVEFDNWFNNESGFNDINGSHVAINTNGSMMSAPQAPIVPELDNGAIRQAWVDYNGATDTLEVRFDVDNVPRPVAPILTKTIDLPAILGDTDAFVGFTSGTGAAGANHDVLSWELNNCFDPIGDHPPTVEAGGPYTGNRGDAVALSGTAADDGGPPATTWSYTPGPGVPAGATCTFADASALTTTVTCTDEGTYTLTLQADDGVNPPVSDSATLTVLNQAPVCAAASPSIAVIRPANHKMVPVTIGGVTDAEGDSLTTVITGIRQDEPVASVGDGKTAPDGSGVGTDTAMVRAERSGSNRVPGNGRVYHIAFTTSDGHGGQCVGKVLVAVPHDQGGKGAAVDGGPLYDATIA